MQWKYEAINDLKELKHKRASLVLLPEEIAALSEHITSVKASAPDSVHVDGGDDHRTEDALLDAIAKRDKLRSNYEVAKKQVAIMEDALDGLPEDMRELLIISFVDRHTVGDIGDQIGVERSQVYRLRDKALRALAIRLYGVVDT